MRILGLTLLFAINALAAEYGVLAVCTKLSGEEYCHVTEGSYRALEIGGRVVIADGFSITRFTVAGSGKVLKAKDGSDVRYTPVKDESGELYMMFDARNNLWISDTTGCVTFKYVAGDRKNFSKLYKFVEMDSADVAVNMAGRCRAERELK